MYRVLVVVLMSNLVLGNSLNLDFRFESDSASYNENAKKAMHKKDTNQFTMRTGRVDLKGTMNENLEFRLRWRIDKDSSTTVHKTDKFTSQIDYAYIKQHWNNHLALTVGKFDSQIGSYEGNMSSPDIYLPSQVYSLLSSNGFLYLSGVRVSAVYDSHDGTVYVANQSNTATDAQTKMMYGLTYQVHFLEDTLSTWLGYLADEKQGSQSDTPLKTTISSLGVRWDPSPFYMNGDYLNYAQKNISFLYGSDVWAAAIFEAGYSFSGIIPKFKYEVTKKKSGVVTDVYEGISAGVEYKPFEKDMFRYHIMLTQLTTKPEAGPSLREQHVLVGTRIYGDFLK